MSEKLEERWPKRWHCVEARDNEYAEQSGPGKPIFAVRNGVNIGTVDICPKCFETFDHHAQPAQPPFTQCQRVRTKDGRVLDVSRCESASFTASCDGWSMILTASARLRTSASCSKV